MLNDASSPPLARPAPRLRDRHALSTGSFPADLLEELGRRVGLASLVFAGVWAVVWVMATLSMNAPGHETYAVAWHRFGNLLTASVLLLSFGVAAFARRFGDRPGLVLHVGLAYEVINAAAIALITHWNPPMIGRGVSWISVTILVFPAIVPAAPLITLAAAALSAAMDPLFYFLAVRAGVNALVPPVFLAWMFIPTFICAALAVIPARLVRRLGRAVREARELGNYRLEKLLGVGGMGEVYRASHRLLARPAAVKLIAPGQLGFRDEAGRALVMERFRREASSAARLRSPHTIELYDFGVADDGTLYYAMELLDGITLQDLVDDHGPQRPGRVIHLLRQACLSLGEAHLRGLVHRDIKPSNLMICRMGTEVDFLKVLDFGLVKVETSSEAALTAPDVAAGTPAYMAPEAIEGVRHLDHRADLYALGCVAYWLLTGREVFGGPTALAVLMKHGREAPPPLSGGVEPVPADLNAVVLQCLEKDPARRPADALALERALARCAAVGQWTQADAERWWAAHLPEGKTSRGDSAEAQVKSAELVVRAP